MSASKKQVKIIIGMIDDKWKKVFADIDRVPFLQEDWILRHCEWELQKLCNMHIGAQWLDENGYKTRATLKKALASYEPELWEQRWYRRDNK